MGDCPAIIPNYVLKGDELDGDTKAVSPGTVVNLKCRTADYVLKGSSRLTCTNGQWSPSKPTCEPPSDDSGLSETMKVVIICIVVAVVVFVILSILIWRYVMRRRETLVKLQDYHGTNYHHDIHHVAHPHHYPPPIPTITQQVAPYRSDIVDDYPSRTVTRHHHSDRYSEYDRSERRQDGYYDSDDDDYYRRSNKDRTYPPDERTFLNTVSTLLLGLADVWRRKQKEPEYEDNYDTKIANPYYSHKRSSYAPSFRADTSSLSGMATPYGIARVHEYEKRTMSLPKDHNVETDDVLKHATWYGR